MKYESPLMTVELFNVNNAVASSCLPQDVTFECMKGPQTDVHNVIIDGANCSNIAKETEYTTAYYASMGRSHSNNTNGTWSTNAKTYTASTGSTGLLVCCMDGKTFSSNHWVENAAKSRIEHGTDSSTHHTPGVHIQVAPLANITTVEVGS